MLEHFRADLHTHTSCSDGSYTPQQLIELAKERGLQAISITDHDTIEAYSQIEDAGSLVLGTGVEISCSFEEGSVHILGYDFSLDSPSMMQLCLAQKERRRQRNLAIFERLAKVKKPIAEEEVRAGQIGRLHIAKCMVDKRYVGSIKEAFSLYLAEQRCCYVKGDFCSVEEAIAAIHQGGGKAFLAHPHLIPKRRWVKKLLQLPFDGIECFYGTFHRSEADKWLKVASERNLLISGGSDFHGVNKPFTPLGASWVDHTRFQQLFLCPLLSNG